MSNKQKSDSENQIRVNVSLWRLTLILLAVTVVQVVAGYIIYVQLDNWNNRADFGEMFGTVNTLFSGWAFAGVIYAIFLQRRELELQRNELEMTREELRRTAEAQEKSEQSLSSQVRELVNQRRLSIMPALLAQIAYRGSENVHREFFILTNIGNGVAINIRIDRVELPFPTTESGHMIFSPLLMLNKGEEGIVHTKTFVWGADEEGESNNFTFIKEGYAHFSIPIHIRFQDIEGNEYIQTLHMGKGGYKQGFVRLINEQNDIGNAVLAHQPNSQPTRSLDSKLSDIPPM